MNLELDRQATACMFPGFEGHTLPDWLRRELGRGLQGVVLFSRNVRDREQLAALTASLRAERPNLLVAVDEEGGDVTRLEAVAGSSYPGNCALGAVDDAELTEEVATSIGSDLAAVGINLDFAPVADVNTNPRNPIIGVRAFASEPELVARHVAAFVSGLQNAGVAACAKHFPGHGDTEQDSHLELPTVEDVTDGALLPFRAALEAGVRAIMTAHIRVRSIGEAPATISPEILQDLLRGRLGFDRLVITDALEMRAVSGTTGLEEGAVRALVAGADAACLGHDLGAEAAERIRRAFVGAVREGRLPEGRLAEAAGRVEAAARWAAQAPAGAAADRAVGLHAARRAMLAEGRVELVGSPLVVELRPERSIAADARHYRLGDALGARLPTELIELGEASVDQRELVATAGDRQLVLVVQDAHRHDWQRSAAERLLAAAPDAIVVEIGLPVWRPTAAGGYVATHGAGRVNLEAAAERLLAAAA
jgi:beta-N-acetylhexosaminidase